MFRTSTSADLDGDHRRLMRKIFVALSPLAAACSSVGSSNGHLVPLFLIRHRTEERWVGPSTGKDELEALPTRDGVESKKDAIRLQILALSGR